MTYFGLSLKICGESILAGGEGVTEEDLRSHYLHSQEADGWILVFSCFSSIYSVKEPSPWDGPIHINTVSPAHLGCIFLESSLHKHPGVCFHNYSKSSQVNNEDKLPRDITCIFVWTQPKNKDAVIVWCHPPQNAKETK